MAAGSSRECAACWQHIFLTFLSLCSESGAIIEHLLHTYAKQPPKWSLEDSYGSHFAEGSLMLYMQMTLMLTTIKAKDPQEDKVVKNSVSKYSKQVIMGRVQSAMDHVSPSQAHSTPR